MAEGTRSVDLPLRSALNEIIGNADLGSGMEGPFRADIESIAAQIAPLVEGNAVLRVKSRTTSAPPASPSTGDRYIIPAIETWGGSPNQLAEWSGSAWAYTTPTDGFTVIVLDEGKLYFYLTATAVWSPFSGELLFATWSALNAVVGTRAGQPASVVGDAGTHTDPVVGGTVANSGSFSWSVSPAGWRWVSADALASKANIDSPVFLNNASGPTRPAGDSSTSFATTEFIDRVIEVGAVDATNFIPNSRALNTRTILAATVTQNATPGPDGLSLADKLVESATTNFHYASYTHGSSLAAGTELLWFVDLKAAERKYVMLVFIISGQQAIMTIDLDTGFFAQRSPSIVEGRPYVEPLGDDWYRCGLWVEMDSLAAPVFQLFLCNAWGVRNYAGDGTSGIYVDNWDGKVGVKPQEIITTGASAVTKKVLDYAHIAPQQYAYRSGVTTGVAAVNDPNIGYILGFGGQSNQAGSATSTQTPIATSALYPGYALSGPYGSRYEFIRYAKFTDLIEQASPAISIAPINYETAASGCVNGLIKRVFDETGKYITVVAINWAIGGLTYQQLKRGTESYSWFLNQLWDAAQVLRSQGKRPVFLAANWMGNEGNYNTPADEWAHFMVANYRQMDEDIRRITGQTEHWCMFIDSQNFTGGANNTGFETTIYEGNRLAALMHPHIKIAHPIYQLPRADAIHLNPTGQNIRGQNLARAIFDEMFGTGWHTFEPYSIRRSGSAQLTVKCGGINGGALNMDVSDAVVTSTGLPSGNYLGFRFDDFSGSAPTVTNHSISGADLILTLSGAPTGYLGRLAYATQRNVTTTTDGPSVGARGCLRKSAGYTALYSLGTQYQWMTPFIREFPL